MIQEMVNSVCSSVCAIGPGIRQQVTNCPEHGNAILEFLLYLPIIALFLVASTDIGLRWSEASAINSALRSGQREAQLVLHQQKNTTNSQQESGAQIVSKVYRHLIGRIGAYKASGIGNVQDDFSVVVQLWESDIHGPSASVQSSTLELIAEEGKSSLSQFSVEKLNGFSSSALPKIVLSDNRGFSTELSNKARFIYARVNSKSPSLAREFIVKSLGVEASVDDEITFVVESNS